MQSFSLPEILCCLRNNISKQLNLHPPNILTKQKILDVNRNIYT